MQTIVVSDSFMTNYVQFDTYSLFKITTKHIKLIFQRERDQNDCLIVE